MATRMPMPASHWCFLVLACGLATGVGATDPPAPPAEATPYLLEPILITPEWYPVDLQRTPITVHHFSGEELDRAGISNSIDLQYLTPGFVFRTNSVLGQPYLRGIGSDFVSAGAESSVATFIDGVYLPRAFDTIVDFFDLERIEVLKGPQAVHLGRNVVGGAVSIHTRDPEPYRSGYADVTVGNYDKHQLRLVVNEPLAGPELVLRLAGTISRRDGYIDNVFLGNDADDEHFHALRGKLLYAPNADLSLLFTAERHREESSRALGPHVNPNVGFNGGIAMGGIVPEDPRKITANVDPDIDVRSSRYSIRLDWRGEGVDFRSTTAYLDTEGALALDLDGTNADYSSNHPWADSETLMQEFRLSSPVENIWSWVGGVFFLREDAFQALDVRLPQAGVRSVPEGTVDTRSHALFGQLAWRFRPDWRAKAGLRYNVDRREFDYFRTLTSPLGTSLTSHQDEERWKAYTPEFGLEYTPDDNRLYYARIARGYKAGGFNTSTLQAAFDPEFLRAYEAGFKFTFPRQRLRLNLALFHYDYRDMQLNTPPADAPLETFPIVINAAQATLRGAELELFYQPRWNLGLSMGLALLDARFDDFTSVDLNNPTDDPDRAGNRIPQAPRTSLNLGAEYRWRLDEGMLTLGAGARYQSTTYFNIYQDPAVRQDGYSLLDASLAYESYQGRWYAELYGRNLTDRLYAQNIFRNEDRQGTKRFWGPPRTLGLRLGYRW